MAMIRYNLWSMSQLQAEINRLFSNWGETESGGATASWVPSVDILEFGDRFQLYVDVPGVDPNAVDITLDNGVLTVSGEREVPSVPEGEQMVHRRTERGQGRFHRRFVLPDTVDADKVKASDRNGMLEISIPKQAKAQPRRIKVAA